MLWGWRTNTKRGMGREGSKEGFIEQRAVTHRNLIPSMEKKRQKGKQKRMNKGRGREGNGYTRYRYLSGNDGVS